MSNQRHVPVEKRRLVGRARRMEGQASGVVRMVEEGRSCEEVLQQIVALTAAADELSVLLIRDHVFERFGGETVNTAALADELARLLKRALRR